MAAALDHFKPGLGDVAMVLAFTGLRWEDAVAVPVASVNLDGQSMLIDRTAGESGGRRDIREDMKTPAAVRTVMIPDIAMPAVSPTAVHTDASAATTRCTDGSSTVNAEATSAMGCGADTSSSPRAIPLRTRTAWSNTPPTSCGTSAPRC